MHDEFFERTHELAAAGAPFATAVVVRAERPTSGKPGDRAIVTLDGRMYGWIGGSCAQPTVIDQGTRCIADGKARLIRLTPEPGRHPVPDGVEEVELTCFSGGTLDIFIEPHYPAPRLIVVGNMPVARALVRLSKAMRYTVTAVDTTGGDDMSHADTVLRDIGEIAQHVNPLTFALVATHGEYDEPALEALLATDAPYIALVASHKRGKAVLESLAMDGIDEATRKRVRFPAGLDIGARHGNEIAVSILAEIVQARRALHEVDWPTDDAKEHVDAPAATAVDPICKMTVRIEGAQHTFEYEGRTYYFCCGGCRTRFAANTEKYLAAS
jgi:xanthine dehydrogenase accessory factor